MKGTVMNPNIYMAYLCFIENDSETHKRFKIWSNKTHLHTPISYIDLKQAMRWTAQTMATQAKLGYIYEAQQAWSNFKFEDFIKFLESYEFRK